MGKAVTASVTALGIVAGTSCPSGAAVAAERELRYGSVLGDIERTTIDTDRPVHLIGNVGAETADYFRGRFDGDPEDIDRIVFGPDLGLAAELWREEGGFLNDLTFALGIQNNFVDPVQPVDDWWYESNGYVALTAGFAGGWALGAFHTIYTSPSDIADTAHETAVAVSYAGDDFIGRLSPQLKLAIPVHDEGRGAYGELRAGPSFEFGEGSRYPVSLSLPVTLGVGFGDYHGPGTDTAGFVGVGATGSVPLAFMPTTFGRWKFSAGVDLLLRDRELRRVGGRFADDDTAIVIGKATISFVY